ncbi:Ig-like domain-containing protein [Mycolicibacterium poriferae]|uniref:Ig-like domain-containing protein n=1 Tax=Mycolicibacterium poriferae TaxID=39694 RepID=UPI0024B9F770|nr:Ig-like domain-containing protein [Mycolicibacterium poriferae]
MVAQQHVGWVAGMAVSAGVGAAMLLGGAGSAAADSIGADTAAADSVAADSAAARNDESAAGSAARTHTDGPATDEPDATDDDAFEDEEFGDDTFEDGAFEDDDTADDDVGDDGLGDDSLGDGFGDDDGGGDLDDDNLADQEFTDGVVDEPVDESDALPAQASVIASATLSSRREPALAEFSNAAPTVTTSVDDPDPLTGVTTVTVAGQDPDGDALTYTAGRPRFGRVIGDGAGVFTYTPTSFSRLLARFLPFARSDRFVVTVNDGHGGATSSTVAITVIPLNSAPRARGVTVNAPVVGTGAVTGKANAFDPNWDRLTFVASTSETAKGVVTVNSNGTFTYTPTAAARHTASAVDATVGDRTDAFRVAVSDVFGAVTEIPVTVTISPANGTPTGNATVNHPDPVSGVVTGVVIGTDADGDSLTYSGSTITTKGTVEVSADGLITYSPNAMARLLAGSVYSTPARRSDSFGVTISDGHGGSTTVTVSVTIAPDTQSPVTVPQSTFCGCTMMPADTIYHADIRLLAAVSESDEWIELLGGSRGATMKARWGGNEWMGSTAGIPVNVVGPDHPTETVIFNRGYSTTGPGIDDRPYAIPDRPLVEGMPSYPAWDRHLFVFQEGTCVSQELINVANGVELPGAGVLDILGNAVYRSIWGSAWIAQGGVHYDMSSALYPEIGFANAAKLPQVPLMVRPDEIERGYIDHMLGITIAKDLGAGYVWPARAGDGSGADGVPMGMVFRLREDVDLSGYAESTQAVLRALQVHGAVIFDSGGPGQDGITLAGMSNGWEGIDLAGMQRELSEIPLQWFEAVDVTGIAADPEIGWQVDAPA